MGSEKNSAHFKMCHLSDVRVKSTSIEVIRNDYSGYVQVLVSHFRRQRVSPWQGAGGEQGQIIAWQTAGLDFPTCMWGLFRLWGEWDKEFGLPLCWLGSWFSGGPDWATERVGAEEKRKIKSQNEADREWSGCVTGGLFCSKSDCFIATQGVSGSRQETMGQQDQYWHSP